MLIRQHQPVTRAQLARLTGLGSGPITQVTRDLLLAGLVRRARRSRAGGQPPAAHANRRNASALASGDPRRLRIVAIDFAAGDRRELLGGQ